MVYALFVVYTALFCWLITRISFFKKAGIPEKLLIALFLIRVLSGILNCYLSLHYFPVSDSLTYHQLGLEEFDLLKHHPREFFTNILYDPYQKHFSGLLETTDSYWNNLKTNAILKVLAVMDIFSLANFYINTLFFNFIVFFGVVAVYRFFKNLLPKFFWLLIIAVFLFPSTLFFTSMIHRDGLIFLLIGIIILHFQKMFSEGISFKSTFLVILSMALIFIFRNFVFFLLIPSLIAWMIAQKKPKFSLVIFSMIFLICGFLFFFTKTILPAADFPKYVAERQRSFMILAQESNTKLPAGQLQGTFISFLHEAPVAFKNAFLLPTVFKANLLEIPFALELLLVELLLILFLIFPKKQTPPAIHFIVFFSVAMLIMIGYTIPILGALVRYRSIYLNFILIAIVGCINWNFLIKKADIKK